MTRCSQRMPEFWDDIVASKLMDLAIAKKHKVTRPYISKVRGQLKGITPRIENEQVVCQECGERKVLTLYANSKLVCAQCASILRRTPSIPPENHSEWKDGFMELYTFFKDVMKDSETILTEDGQDSWNALLAKRNKVLISKLGKEVPTNV